MTINNIENLESGASVRGKLNNVISEVNSLGTIATQNSNNVTITGGSITGTAITGNLTGNASTATALETARTLTIGSTGKTFNGTENVSWSLSEIGVGTLGQQNSNSVNITGGTINGTSIGATTASTGAFTTLTTTGDVGIGTSSPSQKLTVEGGRIGLDNSQALSVKDTGGTYRNVISLNASNATVIGNTVTNNRVIIEAGGSGEVVRIDSSNNVGIGTTSPTSALTVEGTITGTAVTQSRLDTTTGRLMKVGDFGLGQNGLTNIGSDFNVELPTGFFRGNGSGSTNYPGNTAFGTTIIAKRFNAHSNRISFTNSQAWITQHDETGAQTFTPNQIYTQKSILGTVSQSGGDPTGAVIERGSNSNGEYVRFADGTQICWRTVEITLADPLADTDFVYDFAASFSTATAGAFCGDNSTSSGSGWPGRQSALHLLELSLSGSWRFRVASSLLDMHSNLPSAGTTLGVKLIAIGRWF